MGVHKFERVAIIGVGLIGGSLALDAREAGWFGSVIGCGRTIPNLETAQKAGIIDEYTTDPEKAAEKADLVVLATPVSSMAGLADKISPSLKDGSIVTDVGSVKGDLAVGLDAAIGARAKFVAGHPVAGSEKFGAAATLRGLFKGRRCILTPMENTDPEALETIKKLWEVVGMAVTEMDPYRHDRIMAAISHLPHLVAYTLVETVLKINEKEHDALDYAAGGFQDFTRIAGSSPEMWRDIFDLNSSNVLDILGHYREALDKIEKTIKEGDWKALKNLLERSRAAKASLPT